jgi:uncharacterized protein (PEP-CTERM system associated)
MQNNHHTAIALCVAALGALAPGASLAQDPGAAPRLWALESNVTLRQTFTDNQRLQTVKESDAITEASAGVRLTSNAGRVRGFFDYGLFGSVYARNGDANDLRHVLNTAGTAELIDGQAFIDLRGSYSRQAISAFGNQSSTPGLTDTNQSDVASLSISPHVRGRLGSFARYAARLSHDVTRAKDTDAGDGENSAVSLNLDGGASGSPLAWSADASHNISDFRVGRRTYDSRVRVGLSYLFTRELKLGATAGTERTDVRILDGESNATYGVSAEWTPTERTLLSGNLEKRYFGTAHALRFSHRTPNTVWTVSDSRDVSTSSSQGSAGFGSAYDLYFRQFASTEPDAVKRDVLVRNFLQTNGINPNAVVTGGFLASAATLDRAQTASLGIVGVRNTVTVQVSSRRSERADKVATVLDDLSTTQLVRQRGLTLDWAYRLTPQSAISLGGSYQRSEGDLATQETTLKSVTATWTSTLGPRSSVLAGARRATFEGTTPYDENAVFAAFRLSF